MKNDGIINEEDKVVVILTAHGSKFSNAAVNYHQNSSNQFANKTITIEPNIESLERVLNL